MDGSLKPYTGINMAKNRIKTMILLADFISYKVHEKGFPVLLECLYGLNGLMSSILFEILIDSRHSFRLDLYDLPITVLWDIREIGVLYGLVCGILSKGYVCTKEYE